MLYLGDFDLDTLAIHPVTKEVIITQARHVVAVDLGGQPVSSLF